MAMYPYAPVSLKWGTEGLKIEYYLGELHVLLAEIAQRWPYYISWDNPKPADSSAMLEALRKLGTVRRLHTKTSVVLWPQVSTSYSNVRLAIRANLNHRTGKAFYVNLRTGRCMEIAKATNWRWIYAP